MTYAFKNSSSDTRVFTASYPKLLNLYASLYRVGKTWNDLTPQQVSLVESWLDPNPEKNVTLYNILRFKKKVNFFPNPYASGHGSNSNQRLSATPEQEEIEENIKVYPNPTSSILNVDLSSVKQNEKCMIIIYNFLGEKVLSQPSNGKEIVDLDIYHFSNGFYSLIVLKENQIISRRKICVSK